MKDELIGVYIIKHKEVSTYYDGSTYAAILFDCGVKEGVKEFDTLEQVDAYAEAWLKKDKDNG
jgi:hypothetical protein